jgi:hypothetical protein
MSKKYFQTLPGKFQKIPYNAIRNSFAASHMFLNFLQADKRLEKLFSSETVPADRLFPDKPTHADAVVAPLYAALRTFA